MFLFFLNAISHQELDISRLFSSDLELRPVEAVLADYHITGKIMHRDDKNITNNEFKHLCKSAGPLPIPRFYERNIGAYGCRYFSGVMYKSHENNNVHILLSPFPRQLMYPRLNLDEAIRRFEESRFRLYCEALGWNLDCNRNDKLDIATSALLEFLNTITTGKPERNIQLILSGFGLGAERAKKLAVALGRYTPKWKTTVYTFNDNSDDPKGFFSESHRYQVILPDVYGRIPPLRTDVEACLTVHGLTSPLCYTKWWHRFLMPYCLLKNLMLPLYI